jgi:hypothetical protein
MGQGYNLDTFDLCLRYHGTNYKKDSWRIFWDQGDLSIESWGQFIASRSPYRGMKNHVRDLGILP